MIKEYLELGQIVSTHGIKGEVRFNPWCDTPDFVKKFKTLYFDNKGENKINFYIFGGNKNGSKNQTSQNGC